MTMPATSPSTRLPLSLFTIATATMSRSSPRNPEDHPYSPTIARTPTSPGRRAPRYVPGTPRAAWATSLAHGRARHGHAAPAKSCRTPTISARRSTSLATRSSPDTLTSCLGDHGRRRGQTRPPRPRQYTDAPDHRTPPLTTPLTLQGPR
jgi:hypothetical protein